jgi:uncharacterized membrane protein (DUF485 family)
MAKLPFSQPWSAIGKHRHLASRTSLIVVVLTIFQEIKFMQDDLTQRVTSNPKYQELKSKRASFGWMLTAAMMVVYYGFILLVAYNKPLLASKIGSGVITLGLPLGVGVILFTIIITIIYVRRANSEFDELTTDIVKAAMK